MKHSEPLLARLDRFQRLALIIGVVGLIAAVLGIVLDRPQALRSWLFGYTVWIALPVGAFGIYMLHNLVGGAWGFLIRRLLSAAIRTLPLMFLLFIPVIAGMFLGDIYPWARPEAHDDHILHAKQPYLNEIFWLIRSVLYFLLWWGWAMLVFRRVKKLEESAEISEIRKIQNVSAAGLVILILTMTFASVDWLMSLEPHWFSTIFGVQQLVAFVLATICGATLVLTFLADYRPISDVMRPKIFHDLGTLMFAFNMLWAYISFSQLLIIYGGNLAEETPWYLHRLQGGWEWIAYSIIALHFATPFVILLSRRNKRNTKVLRAVAIWLLVMRAVDFFWIITPAFHESKFHIHWLDIATLVGIGGVFIWYFLYQLKQRPLLLTNDPRMQAALAHVEEKEPLLTVAEEDLDAAPKGSH